jgi:hypothetical protein
MNDTWHPFDADRFAEGFEKTECQIVVPPDLPLSRAMVQAREPWAANGGPPDPDDFKVTPAPMDD